MRNGTVTESLIRPLATKLQDEYSLQVLGGCRVGTIGLEEEEEKASSTTKTNAKTRMRVSTVEYTDVKSGTTHSLDNVEGVVLALSGRGMQAVVASSPDLARLDTFAQAAACTTSGIDVMSVRLWLDTRVSTPTPSNVLSRFESCFHS